MVQILIILITEFTSAAKLKGHSREHCQTLDLHLLLKNRQVKIQKHIKASTNKTEHTMLKELNTSQERKFAQPWRRPRSKVRPPPPQKREI